MYTGILLQILKWNSFTASKTSRAKKKRKEKKRSGRKKKENMSSYNSKLL